MRHKILLVLFAVTMIMGSAIAQTQRSVTGQVVDESGEPIIGANIKIVGSPTGTYHCICLI